MHSDSAPSRVKTRDKNQLPRRVSVSAVTQSRYPDGRRPVSWDERTAGVDQIITTDGETITLASNGGQSSPHAGWQLLLTKPSSSNPAAVEWTLYGISKI